MNAEKIVAVFLGISLFAATSGVTSAYLRYFPEAMENTVTSGSVEVELTEPAWQPQKAVGLEPGSTVPKNPTPVNTGKNDAWIFLRLSIPVRHIALVNPQSHRRETPADVPLFSFTADPSWELIERSSTKETQNYVYGYKQIVHPQERASALFEEVRLVNYLEGELPGKEPLSIPVQAVAIQDNVCPQGAPLAEIYRVYLAQEG